MKRISIFFAALLFCFAVVAQDEIPQPAEIIQSARDWMNENLDPRALDALGVDTNRTREFFDDLQKRFQGDYVYDIGALHETATHILPLLQRFEETQPYGIWLQSHLDYFETAEKLQREASPAPPKTENVRLPNPPPKLERSVWVTELKNRPLPPLAEKHVPRLKEIFHSEKSPPELVWIAEVESSFNPRARSPAGAAGLFQLMPDTARSLDLSLWPRDERVQPDKSAHAAAKYLRQLHDRFGDWRLALAAYNAGETRVGNLLKKHKASSYDDIATYLPAETQMFVPKVEATLLKREGRALGELVLPKG